MSDLDSRLIAAHHARDRPALVALYQEAAARAGDDQAAAFFLTQAYVLALEAGLPDAASLHARLVGMGQDTG